VTPALLRAYVRMIPSLRAEESLSRMTEVQFGTGSYRKQDRGKVQAQIRRWEQEAPCMTSTLSRR